MNLADVKKGIRLGKRVKRLGRGEASGHGKTSGRGHKGLKARSGGSVGLRYEGGQMPVFQRIAKRGFSNARHRKEYCVVNVSVLEAFEAGATVGLAEIQGKGWAAKVMDGLKILGEGKLSRKLTVRAQAFSAQAKKAIEDAGGACEVVPLSAAIRGS